MKFHLEELSDIKMIRKVTKDAYKDLGELLDSNKKVPIFGYPLLCYSPNMSKEQQLQMFFDGLNTEYEKKSLWPYLSESIYLSARKGDDLLIKELLDKYDDENQGYEQLL